MIPLHKPFITGDEIKHIESVLAMNYLSGNGTYTQKCHEYFENQFGYRKCLLTNSCTASIEFAALLANIKEGDEVIIPSFTYVSSVNPFILRGAKIVFIDAHTQNPNLDISQLPHLITKKTRAIVVVHYAGIACPMDEIIKIADLHNLIVIEDAAHSLGATYKKKPLGSFGHLSAFSFHATKNITSGEGGLLIVNDEKLFERADILWEKGTNRNKFIQGIMNKYEWCDVGSSFYPSEITAAFLYAQLLHSKTIQEKRMEAWKYYQRQLNNLTYFEIPKIPEYANHNAHLFYLKAISEEKRNQLLNYLKSNSINAAFHYLALDQSPYWKSSQKIALPNASHWEKHIIRLPLFADITNKELEKIVACVKAFDAYE